MDDSNYILDKKLPIGMDFDALKNEALAFIQEHGDGTWTNFNASDPGVTILDQVCFALTELSYCSSFSIPDLLTDSDGDLPFENQFFLPDDILRTDAITVEDFGKIIIDEYPIVSNVVIKVNLELLPFVSQVYQVYLAFKDETDIPNTCEQIYYFLNRHRNMGTFFQYPIPLSKVMFQLSGVIDIADKKLVDSIVDEISHTISNFVFPTVKSVDRIFDTDNNSYDGPRLKNGFIDPNLLGNKKDKVTTVDLLHLLSNLKGVNAIKNFKFNTSSTSVSCGSTQLLVADIVTSISSGTLSFSVNGDNIEASLNVKPVVSAPNFLQIRSEGVGFNDADNQSVYRDVNSYYSIQNTLPSAYGVGESNAGSRGGDYEQAQANQLIGFLTIFDQVLANQFSQLANIRELFSFKNATTGAPSDLKNYLAKKDKLNPSEAYPVPFRAFSPTYFYQSLYDIPNVRPILKRNETFRFSVDLETNKELDDVSWVDYKDDPYNPYIRGLMEAMSDQTLDLKRRNDLLNHLLARHGESPDLIDFYIKNASYCGNAQQDKVIFKSLYLQNLAKLTYHAIRSYSVYGAKELKEYQNYNPKVSLYSKKGYENDFIFNTDLVDQNEEIKQADFLSSSSIELKARILFGLRPMYADFIEQYKDDSDYDIQVKQLNWLLSERQGSILIESAALMSAIPLNVRFEIDNTNWKVEEVLNRQEFTRLMDWVINNKSAFGNDANAVVISMLDREVVALNSTEPLFTEVFVESESGIAFSFVQVFSSGFSLSTDQLNSLLTDDVIVLLPDYVTQFANGGFKNRFKSYYNDCLSVSVCCFIEYVQYSVLEVIIPVYLKWFNGLIYNSKLKGSQPDSALLTENLLEALYLQLYPNE